MSKRLFFIPPVVVFVAVFSCYLAADHDREEIQNLRQTHEHFLKLYAPQKAQRLSRLERIKRQLPPNQFYEQMEYLTMNPALGHPEPHKVRQLSKKLKMRAPANSNSSYAKAPGEYVKNSWISRGPTNVGGRTRVTMFDPTDPSGKRVYAGAISGGLWVNQDITHENSPWEQIETLPGNLNVSAITVDPRDPRTWYIGTGEQYTAGDVVGTGVYKTTNAGETWEKILDVEKYSRSFSQDSLRGVGGIFYINDVVAWDNGSSTEVFIGVSTHFYAPAETPDNILGLFERGLYVTKNGGSTWNKVIEEKSFNDFEIDAEGNLWAVTTYSPVKGQTLGGDIYKRAMGEDTNFEYVTTVPQVHRTEIEASATNPEKFYILAESSVTNQAEMWITTDAFASLVPLNEPTDADVDLRGDFAGQQAFYNLMIESDPTNDNIVYAGGIDLFRSVNSGTTWEQISRWNTIGDELDELSVSEVHADHHVMQFRPGNTNQAIFGHDGGVSFARNLAAAGSSDVFITPERDYVTTQFYSVAVAPDDFASGDYFLGGTQDNGTQLIQNGNPESIGVLGGDGAFSFYDQVDTDYFIANLIYNDIILIYYYDDRAYSLIAYNEDAEGFFINPQALDSNLDLLYSNGPSGYNRFTDRNYGVLYRYNNIKNIETAGEELDFEDPIGTRTSFTNDILDAPISAMAVSPYQTTSSTVYLGLINGKIIRVENANGNVSDATWTEITGDGFIGSISDIQFGSSEDEIFLTFYNYGVRNIWYTENGTDENPNWIAKEGDLPDLPVLSILPNPVNKEEVIIGTELGVWTTENFSSASPDWEHSYNGMSDVKVMDLDLKKGTNEVYAASYGRGLFSGQFKTAAEEEEDEKPLPTNQILVYPTVSEGEYEVVSADPLGTANIYVFDLKGQLIQMSSVEMEANIPVQVNLYKEASGLYFLKVETSSKTQVQKIVKK